MSNNDVSILDCNWDLCPVSASWFGYRPSLPMNAIFLAIFTIACTAHVFLAVRYKTQGFGICMSIACFLEMSGYAGRILAYTNPWSLPAFFIQINGVGLAPTFFAAGIYLCLTRIVIAYGAGISRVQPKVYTYFFVICDIVSLVIQAPGGAISSVSASQGKPPILGAYIGLSGICFQVLALSIWLGLGVEFAFRCKKVGIGAWDPKYDMLRTSWRFKAFLVALGIATAALYVRSVYRIAELSGGYTGHLAKDELAFCILEAVMIAVLSLVTAAFHPGYGFGEDYALITEQKSSYPRPWKRHAFFMKDLKSEEVLIELRGQHKSFVRTDGV
ncbi:uncharacterized protein DFL_002087 [Arthrobotrys flagrans]|uniref:RTA1 like protein n=1 Tax=Arthrobotrys flagrans TaxID=97331 RepID=A0A437A9I4_ARTFL|nr:hypothetical protein DFL_002087 [Arthrobotrys flagrans]